MTHLIFLKRHVLQDVFLEDLRSLITTEEEEDEDEEDGAVSSASEDGVEKDVDEGFGVGISASCSSLTG